MYIFITELSIFLNSNNIYWAKNIENILNKKHLNCLLSLTSLQYLIFQHILYDNKYYYLDSSILTINHVCFANNRFTPCIRQKPLSSISLFLYAHFLLKLNFFKDMTMNFTKTDSNTFHLTQYLFPISGHNSFLIEVFSFHSNSHLIFNANPVQERKINSSRNKFPC